MATTVYSIPNTYKSLLASSVAAGKTKHVQLEQAEQAKNNAEADIRAFFKRDPVQSPSVSEASAWRQAFQDLGTNYVNFLWWELFRKTPSKILLSHIANEDNDFIWHLAMYAPTEGSPYRSSESIQAYREFLVELRSETLKNYLRGNVGSAFSKSNDDAYHMIGNSLGIRPDCQEIADVLLCRLEQAETDKLANEKKEALKFLLLGVIEVANISSKMPYYDFIIKKNDFPSLKALEALLKEPGNHSDYLWQIVIDPNYQSFLGKEAVKLYAEKTSSIPEGGVAILLQHIQEPYYLAGLSKIDNFRTMLIEAIRNTSQDMTTRKNALATLGRTNEISFRDYESTVKSAMSKTSDFGAILEQAENDHSATVQDGDKTGPTGSLISNLGLDILIKWATAEQDSTLRENSAYLLSKAGRAITARYATMWPNDPLLEALEQSLAA